MKSVLLLERRLHNNARANAQQAAGFGHAAGDSAF